jgi:hypothetical protein
MKIRLVRVELFYADGHYEANSRFDAILYASKKGPLRLNGH